MSDNDLEGRAPRPLLHPLLAGRWSPTRFDASHEVTTADVDSMLEAARWAPSAGNSQPWAFIIGLRADDVHARLVTHLATSSAGWAPTASMLVANLSHRFVEDTDWAYSEFALYDLGQAVAHMTLQAQSLGLFGRQFRAFDRAGLGADFDVPDHWEVSTMTAFGRARSETSGPRTDGAGVIAPHAGNAPADARSPRRRRPAAELRWPPSG